MKPRARNWAFLIGVVAIVFVLAAAVLQGLLFLDHRASDACVSELRKVMGPEFDESRVRSSRPEVFFPVPLEKRYRCTCTYGDVRLVLESKPPGIEWRVVESSGLD